MNINTGEMIDEFGAVERWENEGGRISYTQFGSSAGVIKQGARELQALPSPYYFHASPDYSNSRGAKEPSVP